MNSKAPSTSQSSALFYLFASTIVAALGGFLFGFDTAVISGTTTALEQVFALSDFTLGFTVAVALVGTIVGSILVGKPSDRFGRRHVMAVLGTLFLISALGCAFIHNWYWFLFFRFIGGLGVGGASVISPMYIAELSPAHMRGRLVAVQQFNIVLGILIAFLSNYFLADILTQHAWRWMYGVEAVPALLFIVCIFFIPDSPRWLVKKGQVDAARTVLGKTGENKIDKKIDEILQSLETQSTSAQDVFLSQKYKIPIMTAVAIAVFNQLSGINAILYYAPRIFQLTGLPMNTALLQSVAIGVTNLVFTIIAMAIIDKFGRKNLLLVGSVGMVISLGLVAQAFYFKNFSGYGVMIYLVAFIAFFAVSQGAVIWVYISEIFPNRVRAEGQAFGTFSNWTANAVISWTFPIIIAWVGGGTAFLFFSVMMILQFIFVWKYVPETKGKTLEQIQKDLHID